MTPSFRLKSLMSKYNMAGSWLAEKAAKKIISSTVTGQVFKDQKITSCDGIDSQGRPCCFDEKEAKEAGKPVCHGYLDPESRQTRSAPIQPQSVIPEVKPIIPREIKPYQPPPGITYQPTGFAALTPVQRLQYTTHGYVPSSSGISSSPLYGTLSGPNTGIFSTLGGAGAATFSTLGGLGASFPRLGGGGGWHSC